MNFRGLIVSAVAVLASSAFADGVRAPLSVATGSVVAQSCQPQPFSLTAINASSLEPTRLTWNQGSNWGAWHYMDTISAYVAPQCTTTPVTMQAVVDEVSWMHQGMPASSDGTFTNRAGLSQSVFLSSNYYGNGLAVLAAIDSFAGGGEVQGWIATQEVPCHNCHEFQQFAVLYYPATRKVIVLQGYTGYDS
ncbi:hypothetical protein NVS55_24365 [Myxococcus stipitatus]|uniref:hypothetical protein n=1 Tax=Myxococcus stipitatus TaxID=83455 RepID=UPI0031455164